MPLVSLAALADTDEYTIVVPEHVTPQYGELRELLRAEASADGHEATELDLRRLLISLRAAHLLLRSANVGTVELEADFRGLKGLIRSELPNDSSAWCELHEYAGPADHREVVAKAYELLARLALESGGGEAGAELLPPVPVADPAISILPSRRSARSIHFEQSFVDDMVAHWAKPSLVPTSHAVEALYLLHKRRGTPFTVDDGMLAYVHSHYADGAFRPAEHRPPSLYGTRSAIVIYKTALGLICEDTLDDRLPEDVLPSSRREEILASTIARLDEILEEGAAGSAETTIIDLFHALYIMKNVVGSFTARDPAQSPATCVPQIAGRGDAILRYLKECFRSARDESPDGFVLAPRASQRCLTACMFAHRISYDCQISDGELTTMIDRCREFAYRAFAPEGGFGSSAVAAPDMVHTYIGITLDTQREWRLASALPGFRRLVERFLSRCAKGGGFALGVELKPSAYGTRLALQIHDRLELPIANPFAVTRFIESLGDATHGFRGFHDTRPGGRV